MRARAFATMLVAPDEQWVFARLNKPQTAATPVTEQQAEPRDVTNLVAMDSAWLVPVSLAFGVLVGAGLVSILHFAARRGERAVHVVNPAVPDGVDQVVEALESAGVVLDPSNNVVKASPGALAFGLVLGQTLVHPELVALVDRVRRDGESITEEVELSRGPFSDANIFLFVRVARLGARYVLLLAEDRTESYRLDAVRRDFVENISHELKTPIGAVSLLAEALKAASNEPDQVRRFAKRLTKESERLARITQEIIELSRLQAADALAKPDVVDIDHVVAVAIDQNRVAADARHITIVSGGDAGAEVYGDEPLLIVAVHNLISNAVVYSPKGSRVGHRRQPRRRHRRDRRHRPGHRHPGGGPGAGLRAVLPDRPGAFPAHRRVGSGPQHRQARRAEPRRRRAGLVAAAQRIHVHHPAAGGVALGRRIAGRCDVGQPGMTRVLIVEDERSLSEPLAFLLET